MSNLDFLLRQLLTAGAVLLRIQGLGHALSGPSHEQPVWRKGVRVALLLGWPQEGTSLVRNSTPPRTTIRP